MSKRRDTDQLAPQRVAAIDPQQAVGTTRELLDSVQQELGMVPNLIRTMASSPVALAAYLDLQAALTAGTVPAPLRERIALTVAEAHQSAYCLAEHAALGKTVGLSDQDIRDSRGGTSPVRRVDVALAFARRLIATHGGVSDAEIARLHDVGYHDDEIAEIVAIVALNTWTNYFNNLAATEIDYPSVGRVRPQANEIDGR